MNKDFKNFEPDLKLPFFILPKFSMDDYRELPGKAKGEFLAFYVIKLMEVLYESDRDYDGSGSSSLPDDVESKVYYLIKRKEIPHIRIDRNVRVRGKDLENWLKRKWKGTSRFLCLLQIDSSYDPANKIRHVPKIKNILE